MTEEDNAMNTEENITVGEHVGQVQWFNKQKGFGFIKNVNNPNVDIFFPF